MPQTLAEKIWNAHRVALGPPGNGKLVTTTPGGADLIAIDRIFLHERTGAAALKSMAAAGRPVRDPARVFVAMDHIVDTRPGRSDRTLMPGGQSFISETRDAARAAGLTLFDVNDRDQGIVHVVSPELGIVLPGLTLVAPDSHTCTQGAFGALAWGIGSSEAEHAMVTGCLRLSRPRAMRIRIDGRLAAGVTAKDLALALLARFGAGGGAGHTLEYAGSAIAAMDMEARMTLCNMATEFAAFAAIIAPDEAAFAWLAGRRYAPDSFDHPYWRTLASDADAAFDTELAIDVASVAPMISWGTSPEHSIAIDAAVPQGPARTHDYIGLAPGQPIAGTPIDAAFVGSCTNSRLSDLRRAAALARGRHIAPGIQKALVVPGSSAVKRAAEAEGLHHVFEAAGFEWRESGCSLCFYAGGEGFAPGSRTISSTNRNFEGRQGPGIRTHIASPETVVASAIAGVIADPRELAG